MSQPALSAVLITPDGWPTMRRTLAALRTQTVRAGIELVLVGPSAAALDLPAAETEGFWGVRKAVTPPGTDTLGAAAAAGVRAAAAPLVVFTEDHCLPEPGWADALLRFHASGEWAGVEPSFLNGNPASRVSRVQFLVEYAHSAPGEPKGAAGFIAGHNSCYRREALLHYDDAPDDAPDDTPGDGLGDGLGDRLEVEYLMHQDMTARGLKLGRCGDARTYHYNCSRRGPLLRFSWVFPRVFAAHRVRDCGPAQRIRLALLWPLIAPLRFTRIWPLARRLYGTTEALRLAPLLLTNLTVSAASEGLGYVAGAGGHAERSFDLEFRRERFFRRGDRFPDDTADRAEPSTP